MIYDDIAQQQPANPPRQPNVLTNAAAVLAELGGNDLIGALYANRLGRGLTAEQTGHVLAIVAAIEAPQQPVLTYRVPDGQPAQDETAAEPAQ